ncbi:metallophosphoesterase, partial [bacterium]|nr:metallophosphoesterase [bacterium]
MNKYFVLVFIILFIWAFFIEPNLLVIKKYKSDKFCGKKIVFVSDFHISKGDRGRLKRIVNLINKQNPDFVICGGDYVKGHNGTTTLDIETIAEELSKINAPVFSVLGNHDGWYDKYKVKTALEKNGITVLSNSAKEYEGIDIAGVEDLQTGMPNTENALAGTTSPRILVSHTPDIYYDVKEHVDL